MSFPTTIVGQEIRVGDVVRRDFHPAMNKSPSWSGIVSDVDTMAASMDDQRKILKVTVWDGRTLTPHFVNLDSPLTRERSGFDEVWREGWPFQLGLVRCAQCRSLIENGDEREHIAWHVQILKGIALAAQNTVVVRDYDPMGTAR